MVDQVVFKVSKIVGVIAGLRYSVPFYTLRRSFQPLILPHLSYGFVLWGQAIARSWTKLWLLQKRVLRMVIFLLFFISSKIIITNTYASLWIGVQFHARYIKLNNSVQATICDTLIKSNTIMLGLQKKKTFKTFTSGLEHTSFTCFGANFLNCLPFHLNKSPKPAFKKSIRKVLFAVLCSEETYVEAPVLLSKINSSLV